MNAWSWYWLGWFFTAFVTFIVPESIALASRKSYNTLSAQVWRLEGLQDGQGFSHWTALHFLLGGVLTLVLIWLVFHFLFGWFA